MRLRPHDRLTIGYLLATGLLYPVAATGIPEWPIFLAAHVVLAGAVGVLVRHGGSVFPDCRGAAAACRIVRDFHPAFILPFLFKELYFLVPAVHPRDLDGWLLGADRAIFGETPAIALEPLLWPVAVEVFQLSYVSYYLLPAAIALLFYRRGRGRAFEEFLFAAVLAYLASYAGYFLIPAIGPHRVLLGTGLAPIRGILVTAFLREWIERLEWLQRDLFPSGHAAIAILCMVYARRLGTGAAAWILPLGALLTLSTVYLRYHYAVDVVAAVPLGLLAPWFAARVFRQPAAGEGPPTPAPGRERAEALAGNPLR